MRKSMTDVDLRQITEGFLCAIHMHFYDRFNELLRDE